MRLAHRRGWQRGAASRAAASAAAPSRRRKRRRTRRRKPTCRAPQFPDLPISQISPDPRSPLALACGNSKCVILLLATLATLSLASWGRRILRLPPSSAAGGGRLQCRRAKQVGAERGGGAERRGGGGGAARRGGGAERRGAVAAQSGAAAAQSAKAGRGRARWWRRAARWWVAQSGAAGCAERQSLVRGAGRAPSSFAGSERFAARARVCSGGARLGWPTTVSRRSRCSRSQT